MSKRRCRRNHLTHARRRLEERYGLRVMRSELREVEAIIEQINARHPAPCSHGRLLEKMQLGRNLYQTTWRARSLLVVWTPCYGGTVVTFLPPTDPVLSLLEAG